MQSSHFNTGLGKFDPVPGALQAVFTFDEIAHASYSILFALRRRQPQSHSFEMHIRPGRQPGYLTRQIKKRQRVKTSLVKGKQHLQQKIVRIVPRHDTGNDQAPHTTAQVRIRFTNETALQFRICQCNLGNAVYDPVFGIQGIIRCLPEMSIGLPAFPHHQQDHPQDNTIVNSQ